MTEAAAIVYLADILQEISNAFGLLGTVFLIVFMVKDMGRRK